MRAILLGQLLGDLVVGLGVAADHLQIDRRGQPEVQNLAGDVGRLEEEVHVREFLAQALAEQHFVVARWSRAFPCSAKSGFRRRRSRWWECRPARWLGQLFGMPMLSISVSISSGGITARISRSMAAKRASVSSMRVPAGAARVQPHLAGIDVGEEILADQPDQAQRGEAKHQESREHAPAMPQGPIEQAHVAEAEALEHAVEQMVAAPEQPCRRPCRLHRLL